MRTTVFLSGMLGVLLFVTAVIIGGALLPGYSHVSQFISESYAIDTPHGLLLRFAGYLPSGILVAVFAWASVRVLRLKTLGKLGFGALGVFYGLGTVVTAFFPCDAGCAQGMDPSVSQLIHNLSGLLTYLIAPAALIVIGAALRRRRSTKALGTQALWCGSLAMAAFVTLIGTADTGYAGLVQRVIEGAILTWIVICAVKLRNATPAQ